MRVCARRGERRVGTGTAGGVGVDTYVVQQHPISNDANKPRYRNSSTLTPSHVVTRSGPLRGFLRLGRKHRLHTHKRGRHAGAVSMQSTSGNRSCSQHILSGFLCVHDVRQADQEENSRHQQSPPCEQPSHAHGGVRRHLDVQTRDTNQRKKGKTNTGSLKKVHHVDTPERSLTHNKIKHRLRSV